ncbi:hypothetical protein [Polaribacter sp. Hel1_85]|uniref:hypothetical protein n=1 Tax=Polaribacter sp. Hel1_85 TaxID=1250005 RepID=UPI00052D0A89|nr:hypothetical protein [Polaribacter sp. Hel1_85]KGL62826.1 hypothetical protein PHEL85_2621 [Polaribacter sp. Hel1_85]
MALTANVSDKSSMFSVKNIIELKDCFGTIIYTSKEGKSKEKDYKKAYHEAIRNAYATMGDLEYKYQPKNEIDVKEENLKTEVTLPIKKVIPVEIIPEVKEVAQKDEVISKNNKIPSSTVETLYAQEKSNGFQLVNTIPAIIFQVLKTKVKDVFIIKDKNGIMYKSDHIWVAEYYENGKLVVKNYNLKF